MEFTWDEGKAARNLQKHGVSFEVAQLVWDDPGSCWCSTGSRTVKSGGMPSASFAAF